MSSFGIALIYDAIGEPERAMSALERAYEDHAVELAQPNQFPPFKSLQSDPRYQALRGRVHRKPENSRAAN